MWGFIVIGSLRKYPPCSWHWNSGLRTWLFSLERPLPLSCCFTCRHSRGRQLHLFQLVKLNKKLHHTKKLRDTVLHAPFPEYRLKRIQIVDYLSHVFNVSHPKNFKSMHCKYNYKLWACVINSEIFTHPLYL